MAIAISVLLAGAGWFATGFLNRRSDRRRTRIEYLLSAYRRLDDASNRAGFDQVRAAAIESAIADVQLLGTREQVEIADSVSRKFAAVGSVELNDLLENLRRSLRKELLLDGVPKRATWLRLGASGDVWARESSKVEARIREVTKAEVEPPGPHGRVCATADQAGVAQIEQSYQRLMHRLRAMNPVSSDISTNDELVALLVEQGKFGNETADALRGMSLLYRLATQGRHSVSQEDIEHYNLNVESLLYVLDRVARP